MNEKVKKVLSVAMAAILCCASVRAGSAPEVKAAEPTTPEMVLQYDSSATEWKKHSLPIGNGVLGANVFGGVQQEHLTLNEETLWSGGRGSVTNYTGGNPDESKVSVYNQYADRYLKGSAGSTDNNIEGLASKSQATSGYDKGYQPLGDLYFNFEGNAATAQSGYLRSLSLNEGVASVSYANHGTTYTRKYFASNPDNVIVSRVESNGSDKLTFTVSMTSKHTNAVTVNANVPQASTNCGYITVKGKMGNDQARPTDLKHNTQIAVVADDGTVSVSGNGIKVSGATSATVYVTAATDYKNTFYDAANTTEYYYRTGETDDELNTRVKAKLDAAVTKGYARVLESHQTDYKKLYDRVDLNLGQKNPNNKMTHILLQEYKSGSITPEEKKYLEVLLYQYGRYLIISSSRENSQIPANLQGIWNDSTEPNWGSDIHTNINIQMNYWLTGNCNLAECATPLVKYVADLKIPGGKTVEKYTGCKHGIMAHTQNTPFGYTSPGWGISTWGWSPAASTWMMQNCYDYYEFSKDEKMLRETIYPMLKEQVLMYQELLKPHNGRMIMPIAQSPEFRTISAGNTYEQSLIWQLYADTIEAANILNQDQAEIAKWQATMEQLKPIEIGNDGQIKEWYHETTLGSVEKGQSGHRHLSNLLGLFPGDLCDTPEEIEAAKVSLNYKNFGRVGTSGNDPEGGWTYGQLINSWARVGHGQNAYFSVEQLIKKKLFDNLWDLHDTEIYQIDGNLGYSAGVAEMLLQSNLGKIDFLPALPTQWATGSVKGLRAEGAYTVDMEWKDSKLTTATVTPDLTGTCTLEAPANQIVKVTQNGTEVAVTQDYTKGTCSFEATAKTAYTVTYEDRVAINARGQRQENGNVVLTWEGKDGVTYTITRRKK